MMPASKEFQHAALRKPFSMFSSPIALVLILSIVYILLPTVAGTLDSYLPSPMMRFLDQMHTSQSTSSVPYVDTPAEINGIPNDVREYWMLRAVNVLHEQLDTPCPWGAFGSVVVNHTNTEKGEVGREICVGVNRVSTIGNPTLHGEVSNINNCTSVLSQPPYNLSPSEILTAWSSLSLYTTGEPCPMCASSIRWSGFRECIFATSIDSLVDMGWVQIDLRSREVFARSQGLSNRMTSLLGGVLTDVTDGMFSWQFQDQVECPTGCQRDSEGQCSKI